MPQVREQEGVFCAGECLRGDVQEELRASGSVGVDLVRHLVAALIATSALISTAMGAELGGGEWQPISIGSSPVPSDTNMFVQFKGDGQLAGHGGCNRFFGSYRITGGMIEIGPLGATRMACPGSIMALETVLFNALEAADTFERKDPELVLRDRKGMELARFRQTKSI
jgi:heat shock protein HslJ